MDEKKKKPSSKYSFWRIFAYVSLAIMAIPLACGGVISLVVAYDEMRMHQCFDEGEPLEWNGLLDFPALAGHTPISQSNLAGLSLLPYSYDDNIFPNLGYYSSRPISHPEHDYFLSSNIRGLELYGRPKLILCQPNGWASHILSFNVRQYRFSPDGTLFATISDSYSHEEIEIYDANSLELLRTFTVPRPESASISHFAFHPTEPLIAFIASESNIARLHFWNYETQEEPAAVFVLGGAYLGQIDFLAFNEEGSLLIARRQRTETTMLVWGILPE